MSDELKGGYVEEQVDLDGNVYESRVIAPKEEPMHLSVKTKKNGDAMPTEERTCIDPERADAVARARGEAEVARIQAAHAQLAILIAARTAHEVNRVYCQSLGDDSQLPWDEASEDQRASCIAGVTLIAKHPQTTSAQSHSCWMAHKLSQGWVPGPKNEAAKTHPCLLPYDQLPEDQKLKDAFFTAVVRGVLGIQQ